MTTRWTGLSPVTRRAPDAPQMDPNRVAPARTAGRRRGRAGVRRPDEREHLRDRLSRFRPTQFRLTMQMKIALSGLFFGTFLVAGGLFVAYLNADEARVEQFGLIGAFIISLTSSATVVLPAPGILIILCAIAGAIPGGTPVAVFMALAGIGGLLAAMAVPEAPKSPE